MCNWVPLFFVFVKAHHIFPWNWSRFGIWNFGFVRKNHLNQTSPHGLDSKCSSSLCNWGVASIRIKKQSRQGRLSFGADGFYEGSFEAGHIWYFFTTQLQQHFLFGRETPGQNERLEPEQWGQMIFLRFLGSSPLVFSREPLRSWRCFWGIMVKSGWKGSVGDS